MLKIALTDAPYSRLAAVATVMGIYALDLRSAEGGEHSTLSTLLYTMHTAGMRQLSTPGGPTALPPTSSHA